MLWGNSTGCSGLFGCRPTKSLTASPKLARAVVNTPVLCPGSAGAPEVADWGLVSSIRQPRLPARMSALTTRALRTRLFLDRRLRRLGRSRTDAADEVDDLPDVLLGQGSFHAHHPGLLGLAPSGRSAIPDEGEHLAIAGTVIPLRVRQVCGLGILRGEQAVAPAPQAVAMPAILGIELLARFDRRRIGRNRILPRGQLRIAPALLCINNRGRQRNRKHQSENCRHPTHRRDPPGSGNKMARKP